MNNRPAIHASRIFSWPAEPSHLDGLRTLTVRVSGWHLRNGQIKPVRVCR